jgi:hypothetical protein
MLATFADAQRPETVVPDSHRGNAIELGTDGRWGAGGAASEETPNPFRARPQHF